MITVFLFNLQFISYILKAYPLKLKQNHAFKQLVWFTSDFSFSVFHSDNVIMQVTCSSELCKQQRKGDMFIFQHKMKWNHDLLAVQDENCK